MSAPSHPFARLSQADRRRGLLFGGIGVFALTAFLAVLGGPLATPAAPRGIISFELAGSADAAAAIVASWSPALRQIALLHLALDYLYLLAYPALLPLACGMLAERLAPTSPELARLARGAALPKFALVAAALLYLVLGLAWSGLAGRRAR